MSEEEQGRAHERRRARTSARVLDRLPLPRTPSQAKDGWPEMYNEGLAQGRIWRDHVGLEKSRLIKDDHQRAAFQIGVNEGLKPARRTRVDGAAGTTVIVGHVLADTEFEGS